MSTSRYSKTMFNFGSGTAAAPATSTSGLFGAKPATTGFTFGGAAGTNPTTSATGTGFSFGAPAAQTGTSGGLFGAAPATSTASTGFAGFGSTTATSTAPTGFTGFGGLTGKPAATGGLFGTSTATTSASTGFAGFGTATSTAASGFTGFGGFGAATSKPGGLFGTTTSTATGFTGFGGLNTTTSTTGKPPTLSTGTTGVLNAEQVDVLQSTFVHPLLFGDERDIVLSRWNQLQALWGTGMGFSSKGAMQYTPYNPFCKLKALVYNVIPSTTDSDGIVSFCIQSSPTEVLKGRQGVQDMLFRILGSKTNLHVNVDEIRPANSEATVTEVVFYVVEKSPTGLERRVPASELVAYLNGNASAKGQLQSQLRAVPHPSTVPSGGNASSTTASTFGSTTTTFSFTNPTTAGTGFGGFGSLGGGTAAASQVPLVRGHLAPSSRELQQYLDATCVLLGYSPSQWQEARRDNPDPQRLLPVPIIGMADLKRRLEGQTQFAKSQLDSLKKESNTIQSLKNKCSNMIARVEELKRKQAELEQRVLKVFCGLEVYRKQGLSLSSEEEQLRVNLERLWSELMSTTAANVTNGSFALTSSAHSLQGGARSGGLKARVQECVALCRSAGGAEALMAGSKENNWSEVFVLDPTTQTQLKLHLDKQSLGIQEMLNILQEDMEMLQVMRGSEVAEKSLTTRVS